MIELCSCKITVGTRGCHVNTQMYHPVHIKTTTDHTRLYLSEKTQCDSGCCLAKFLSCHYTILICAEKQCVTWSTHKTQNTVKPIARSLTFKLILKSVPNWGLFLIAGISSISPEFRPWVGNYIRTRSQENRPREQEHEVLWRSLHGQGHCVAGVYSGQALAEIGCYKVPIPATISEFTIQIL